MKSTRVICILFFFCGVLCNATTKTSLLENSGVSRLVLDSIIESQTKIDQEKNNAEDIIKQYDILIDKGIHLENEDYKRLALSYATIEDAKNSSAYLEKYIKNSFDTKILYSEEFHKVSASNSFQTLIKKYMPKINAWILFFIFSGIVGVFISITINLRKKGDRMANLFIGLFVFLHSLFILHLSLYLTNYIYYVPHSFWVTITFSFLYGPLLYFYFKRISNQYSMKKSDLIHFLPTFIIIIYFIPIYLQSSEIKQFKIFNVDNVYVTTLYTILVTKAISLLIYSTLVYRIYVRQRKKHIKVAREINLWQRNISYLNIFYAITYTVYAFIIATNVVFDRSKSFMLYSQVFVLAIIVLYVAYTAYVQPRVFSKKYLFNELSLKYEKSGLTQDYSIELKEQLLKLLKEEKIYKTNDISLNLLSDKMGITRHNLSQVINEHFNMNFFNLINKFRIEEAQRILVNDNNQNLNIIDVAYDVGFNNKVTFNKAFKEATQLTPSQFLKQQRLANLGVNFK